MGGSTFTFARGGEKMQREDALSNFSNFIFILINMIENVHRCIYIYISRESRKSDQKLAGNFSKTFYQGRVFNLNLCQIILIEKLDKSYLWKHFVLRIFVGFGQYF